MAATVMAVAVSATISGCDPIITIAGALFPAWLFCAMAGLVTAISVRPLFIALGLEPFMRPLILIYPSIAVTAATLIWLLFFNRL